MTQQSGLRLDNRATGLLAGLILLVAIGILAAIYFDSGNSDEVATINPDEQAATDQAATDQGAADQGTADQANDAGADAGSAADEQPAVIPDAQPTSVFVPAGGAAPAADADSTTDAGSATDADSATTAPADGATGGALVTDFEDDFVPEENVESNEPETVIPEPTARTNDPFAYTGPASFWEDDLLADGGTINTNELDFVINNDGTGAFRGTLDVSYDDGRSIVLSVDRDFEWDNEYTRVRATLAGDVAIDGVSVGAGTLAIREVKDGFGSLCFERCVNFQFDPPFWSLSPDA